MSKEQYELWNKVGSIKCSREQRAEEIKNCTVALQDIATYIAKGFYTKTDKEKIRYLLAELDKKFANLISREEAIETAMAALGDYSPGKADMPPEYASIFADPEPSDAEILESCRQVLQYSRISRVFDEAQKSGRE